MPSAPPQVDMHCLDTSARVQLPKEWKRVHLDEDGQYDLQMLPPALAIAILMFHPLMWPNMRRKAEPQFNAAGEREYGHPFTCDELERCQEELTRHLHELGLDDDTDVINILVGIAAGKDKTDVERMRSVDALHLKLLNTGLKEWHQRHSKVLGALFPILVRDEDDGQVDHARAKQRLYQRGMACWLVCLEVCAREGIRVTHRCPPRRWHCICNACARHMLTFPPPTQG